MNDKINIITYVVDDDKQIDIYINDAIGDDTDFRVSCFHSPVDFKNTIDIAKEKGEPVDLVITDIMMPGYDVFQSIEHLSREIPNCYIIVISAHITLDIIKKLKRLRVDDWVEKNGDWPKELRETINWLKPRIVGKILARA